MKRIAILTAGGDTPALNATIAGAVTRANQRRVEVVGLIKGFSGLLNPRVPHVLLNPLFTTIPEIDPTFGGTILGASRDYVDADDHPTIAAVVDRLHRLKVEGLVCVGGDGTLNGMQALGESLPAVLAPKTIDNDLGLNYRNEPDEWVRHPPGAAVPDSVEKGDFLYTRSESRTRFDLDHMVNYVTPGYATAVFVSARSEEHTLNSSHSLHDALPICPRAEDDRQRPRPELPQRAGRVGPTPAGRCRAGLGGEGRLPLHPQRVPHPLRPRSHGELRHARLRDGGVRVGKIGRAHAELQSLPTRRSSDLSSRRRRSTTTSA